MTDLLLDPSTHDLDLSSGTVELATGADAIAQHIRVRLRLCLGEWFLDERVGVPYFQEILGQRRTAARAAFTDQVLREVVSTTPGVLALTEFSSTFVGLTRELQVAFVATVDGDTPLTFDEAFVLTSTPEV